MALVAAKCTQCGGSLKVDDSKDAGICPFCGTAFVTEKVIQNYNIHVTNNIDTVIVQHSEKNEMIERCKGFLELKNYDSLYNTANGALNKYPNELYFYVCCLLSIMEQSPNPRITDSYTYGGFGHLLKTANTFRNRATEWERKILNDAERYQSDPSIQIQYPSLTNYYELKWHISYEKAKKLKRKRDIKFALKYVLTGVRSFFLFWLPLIILIGTAVVAYMFRDAEVSNNTIIYIAVVPLLYSVIAFVSSIYVLYTSIRESAKTDKPVIESLSDFISNKINY